MNLVFPVASATSLDEPIFGHFGSAPHFALYDTSERHLEFIENPYAIHDHGNCKPADALEGLIVEAVVCKNLGKGALNSLTEKGYRVLKASPTMSIGQAVIAWREGALLDFPTDNLCNHDH